MALARFLLIFALVFSSALAKTYKNIQLEGLSHLSTFSANELMGFSAGDEITEYMINAAIKRFFAQGYFLDITVNANGNELIFAFKEKPVIENIAMIGVSDTDIKEKYMPLLGFKKGDIYDALKLERAKANIVQYIRAQGFYGSVVEAETESTASGVKLKLMISKGKKIIIYDSRFKGLKAFKETDFDDVIANKKRQIFPWFFGQNDGLLNLLALDLDDDRIKDFYMRYGYLDATVSEPFLEANFDNFSAKITYEIEEGKPYTVSALDLEFTDKTAPVDTQGFKQKAGKIFSIEKVRKDLEYIKEEVGAQGYAFARVFPDVIKDEKTLTAKLIYKVTCGEKVYINDVLISGNTRTLDRVIRREIFLAPGDLYDLREIKESKASLGRLGFFEKIDIKEERVLADKINLLVEVKETNTGSLKAGAGWNSYSGFTFTGSLSDRNVFGSSIGFSLDTEFAKNTEVFSFTVTNPRLNDSDYSASASVSRSYYKTDSYKTRAVGTGVTFGKYLDRHWYSSLGLTYGYSENEYYKLHPKKRPYYYEGRLVKISLIPRISYDNTDDYFVPRSGAIFSTSLELAGIGGDQKFAKLLSNYAYYYGLEDLINFDLILRFKLSGGFMQADLDNSKEVPLDSRLYMGGFGSVRGFERNSISPLDLDIYKTSKNEDDIIWIGGKNRLTSSFELSLPLVPKAKMRLVGFFDYGVIGKERLDIARSSTGAGIEWYSPMGPLAFIWAWPLKTQDLDRTNVFEFNLGQKF